MTPSKTRSEDRNQIPLLRRLGRHFALAGSQVFPAALPAFRHLSPLASAARKCYNRLMNIPSDPVMMLSALNMLLRDRYPSLAELCAAEGLDKSAVETALAAIDYRYDPEANQFV